MKISEFGTLGMLFKLPQKIWEFFTFPRMTLLFSQDLTLLSPDALGASFGHFEYFHKFSLSSLYFHDVP